MAFKNLRDYLVSLEDSGLLHVVEDRISKDTELVPLVRLQFRGLPEEQRKAFWFKNVTDARGRDFDASVVLGSLGSSSQVYAAALGVERDQIGAKWASTHGNPLPPVEVPPNDAPVGIYLQGR